MKTKTEIIPNLSEQSNPSERLYFLDNLRTFIILFVVIFHTAHAFSLYFSQGWYVVNNQKSLFFDIFILSVYSFLMPVMFFIAGFFGIRSLARKGQLTFWKDKFFRIMLPWVLGVILLAPAMTYTQYLSRGLHPAYLNYWLHYFFSPDYQNRGQGPLYYLGVLSLYYAVLSIVYLIYKPLSAVHSNPVKTSRKFLILFGLATGIVFFCGNLLINEALFIKVGPFEIPATRFIPYLCYFFLGVLAYKQQWFGAMGFIPKMRGGILYLFIFLAFTQKGLLPGKIGMACYAVSYYFFCLYSVLALLAFFQKRINYSTKLLSSLAANSYAIYFIHMLIVLPILLVFKDVHWNLFIKYPLVAIIAVLGCYLVSKYILSFIPVFKDKVKPGTTKKDIPVQS